MKRFCLLAFFFLLAHCSGERDKGDGGFPAYPFAIISDCAMGSEGFNDTEDGVALFFALLSRKVCVSLIVSTFGNVPEDEAYQNILKIVEIAKGYDLLCVPEVVRGAAERGEKVSEGAKKLVELSRKSPVKLGVVSLGSLTTLRQALEIDAEFPYRISLFVMGGTWRAPGNVPFDFVAEANFFFDPDATREVVRNFRMQIYPLDLAYKFHVSKYLDAFGDGPVGSWIMRTSEDWFRSPFAFLFDTLAVAGALYPELVTKTVREGIDIGNKGEVIPGEHVQEFVLEVSRDVFRKIFFEVFEGK